MVNDAAVVEVSLAGRACVGAGLLLFVGSLVLVGFNEQSVAQAHGQLFSITQAAQHIPCDAKDKSVAKLQKASGKGAQPVFLSCPITEVSDLSKNPQLAAFGLVFGEDVKGLQLQVDTQILQWTEEVNPECDEESKPRQMKIEQHAWNKGAQQPRGALLEMGDHAFERRQFKNKPHGKQLVQDEPNPTGAKFRPMSGSKGIAIGAESKEPETPQCVYTYSLTWQSDAVDSSGFGCSADRLRGLKDEECDARCVVPGRSGLGCAGAAIKNEGRIAAGLKSQIVRAKDGEFVVGDGYHVAESFLTASSVEWDRDEVNGDKMPELTLVGSANIKNLKDALMDPEFEGNIEVEKQGSIFISRALRGETVGDVRAKLTGRLAKAGSVVSVLAAMSQDGDNTRLVPWETGLHKPVDKIAWIDFSKNTLDDMVAERIYTMNNVSGLSSWMLRVTSWSMLYIGLVMVCWPLSVAPEIMPVFGRLVAGADAGPLLIVCALLSLCAALMVTSICWLFSGLTVRGLWLLGAAFLAALPIVLTCSCMLPRERSRKRASYLEGEISISALKMSTASLGRAGTSR